MFYGSLEQEIAKQRIGERVRQAEAERVSRPVAEFRMAARRDKARRAAAALASVVWTPARHRSHRLAGTVPAQPRTT